MALLSFRGIITPSLQAQGGQRRSSYFNIDRDIPGSTTMGIFWTTDASHSPRSSERISLN